SQMGSLKTSAAGLTSARSDSSRIAKEGFSGVSTYGCHPNSGRYFTNFNHRCTPLPPEGGQWYVIMSTFFSSSRFQGPGRNVIQYGLRVIRAEPFKFLITPKPR